MLCFQQWKIISPTNRQSVLYVYVSKTSNPQGDWTGIRILEDSVAHDSLWIDRPDMAMSKNEVFISANLMKDGGSFKKLLSIALKKSELYSWTSPVIIRKFNIPDPNPTAGDMRATIPMSWGRAGNYGPGIYLLRSYSAGYDSIWVYDVDADVFTDTAELFRYAYKVNPYGVIGGLSQKGTATTLEVGTCRMLDAFFLDGTIHYVFHKRKSSLASSKISYGRINLTAQTLTEKEYSPAYNCAYPSISYFPTSSNSKTVLVHFLTTSSTTFPSIRAIAIDDTMGLSNELMIKAGDTCLISPTVKNWGDYTGNVSKHNVPFAASWVYGSYFKLNPMNQVSTYSYLCKVIYLGIANGLVLVDSLKPMNVYPNPAHDYISIDFEGAATREIEANLYDMSGKMVRQIYVGLGSQINSRHFDISNLTVANYLLVITDKKNKQVVGYEKLIIL